MLLAASLVAAVAAAPSAAASGSGKSKATAAAKAKARAAATDRRARRQARRANRRITATNRAIATANTAITAVRALADGINGRTGVIEGLVPTFANALTALQAGLTTVGSSLQTLADATTAGFAEVEAGFAEVETGITEVATSQEYGVVGLFLGPGGAGGSLGITVGSADIPDDGNSVAAMGEIPISVGDATPDPGQVPEGVGVSMHASIRSGESDGVAGGDPAGYAGGLFTITCGGGPLSGACDADPGAGTTPVPAGTVLCVVGPPPDTNMIEIPGEGVDSFPLVTIPEKAERTDQDHPDSSLDATDVNPVAGATVAGGSVQGPLGDDTNDGCTVGDEGNLLLANVQVQFVDIPTSEDPGPTE